MRSFERHGRNYIRQLQHGDTLYPRPKAVISGICAQAWLSTTVARWWDCSSITIILNF